MLENLEKKKTPNTKKGRIEYLDVARTFAILCVVLCHCVEKVYGTSLTEWRNSSVSENIFSTIIFIIGRLGVPIFLFITGVLILNKKFENENDITTFYKKNLIPLIITAEIWTVLYVIIYSILFNQKFEILKLLKYMLFLDTITTNIYYMPMIIGMYIALPFVSIILKKFSIKLLRIPLIITLAVSFGVPLLNVILKFLKIQTYKSFIDVSFLGGQYGIYIIFGYLIGKGYLKKIKSIYLYIITISLFILTCEINIVMRNSQINYRVWYDSIFLLICAISLFELFTRIKINDKMKKITLYISKISLGIYFVHIVLIEIQWKYISLMSIQKQYQLLVMFIGTCTISILSIVILSKVKFLKNKIFLIKE